MADGNRMLSAEVNRTYFVEVDVEARSPLSPCSRVASAELGAGMAKARWAMAPYLSLYS